MNVKLRPVWLLCLLMLGMAFNLSSQNADRESIKVNKIILKHTGPPAASEALIRGNIKVKEGDNFSRPAVDDDIRNLYATGYFINVQVGENRGPNGTDLTYTLQGKPLLTDIKFSGNKKFNNAKLLKAIKSKTGQPLDEQKLFLDSLELVKKYQKVGYQKTTVEPKARIDESTGRASATFEIKETGKIKIKDIVFDGASAFTQKKLRKQLKTKKRWMFSWLTGSGVLKEDEFEDDKQKLIEFYQNEGYIDFEIKDVKFDYETANKLVIHIVISEGTVYKVGQVTLKGNHLFTTDEIMKGFTDEGKKVKVAMTVGKKFTPVGLNKDIEAIKDFYGSKGYLDIQMNGNNKVNAIKNANVQTGTMDLIYEIEEGEKVFVEKIEIKGNNKTKDKVLRRELAVSPGEVYDTVRVKISKERLEGLQYFEKVETQAEETDVKNRKNLVIGVEEKNTGNFTIGAGISSVDSVVGFAEVSQGNFDLFHPPTFTGAGQKFRLRTSIGTVQQDYQLTFIEPWFLGQKLALGVDLFHRDLGFLSDIYDERHTGATLSLTKALLGNENIIGKLSYTIENVGIKLTDGAYAPVVNKGIPAYFPGTVSPEIYSEVGSRWVSKIGTSLAYDTRNNTTLPNRGQRSEFLTEFAGLGGDSKFYKLEAKSSFYFPGFGEGHVFEIGGRSGVVDVWGDATRVPLFDRWYLGGLYSLRGYKYRHVGPKDYIGEPIGGGTYWFGTAEYSLPIIERLRFAMFYDVGNVYSGAYDYSHLNKYNDNWGIGLRINLPIGPLRLDYGIPITHDESSDGGGKFNFGVGYQRDF